MKKTIISPETHLQSLRLASRHHAQPRISCGPQIGLVYDIWIYNMILHDTIIRRRRIPGCWRWPQLESLRWILFCFLLNYPHSGFRRFLDIQKFDAAIPVSWRQIRCPHVQKRCAMTRLSISRDLPISQVYFNAAGRLLATSRQTLLHCHWATTRPPGPSFQKVS